LMTIAAPSADEEARMALARLTLVAAGHFHLRQTEQVASFLRRHPDHQRTDYIRAQLAALTRNTDDGDHHPEQEV
jgi:outer membrane lipopolysaccharide assembly protein LptE/RlpB